MSAGDDEDARARLRLIAAMKKLGLFSRVDDRGIVLGFDGQQEYEVAVDLSRLLSKAAAQRKIVVGKSSLAHLENGDVTALFPYGVVSPTNEGTEAAQAAPVSPHYRQLQWVADDRDTDDDGLIAEGDDWTYSIGPVRQGADEVIGYRVSGGNNESGTTKFGSSLVGGMPGELTLEKAKAVAQQDYSSRYLEADRFLDGLLCDLADDDGPRTRRNDRGRIMCRIDDPGIDEVEVVSTLEDYGDGYDAVNRRVTICLRTLMICNSDPGVLLEVVDHILRRQARS